jgi:predicted RNA binding protein YcfA (HicA-like mRNA interferase family)
MILWRCNISSKEKRIKRFQSKPYRNDIRFDELVLFMQDFGYTLDRIKGSHVYFVHSNYPSICVPKHEPVKVFYIKRINEMLNTQEESR